VQAWQLQEGQRSAWVVLGCQLHLRLMCSGLQSPPGVDRAQAVGAMQSAERGTWHPQTQVARVALSLLLAVAQWCSQQFACAPPAAVLQAHWCHPSLKQEGLPAVQQQRGLLAHRRAQPLQQSPAGDAAGC
jgi:hypothetical protein